MMGGIVLSAREGDDLVPDDDQQGHGARRRSPGSPHPLSPCPFGRGGTTVGRRFPTPRGEGIRGVRTRHLRIDRAIVNPFLQLGEYTRPAEPPATRVGPRECYPDHGT